MIQFIRSLSELMAITKSRDSQKLFSKHNESYYMKVDSEQKKRYIRSLEKKEVDLPNLPKIIRRKLMQKKETVSKVIDDLDYNNLIQASYDLTLIERQNKQNQQDVV